MLDAIRKKKENFFYTFILLAVIAVMAFYGLGQTGDEKSDGGVAAWVNGEAISNREFRQQLEYRLQQYQQMFGNQYDEKLLYSLQVPQRTLEEMVQYKLLAQQSQSLGVIVSDGELAEHIRGLPYFQKDGKFDAEQYRKLPNRGTEEKGMRERMQTAKWQGYLSDRIRMTPYTINREVSLQQTKVDLDYAKIDFLSLAPSAEPTAKDIETFKKDSAGDIKNYYDTHRAEFTDKASVELRQIRVGIPFQADDKVKAEAKKKADALVAETNKDNFGAIAKAKSDDEHAKREGLVGWVTRGTLEKPLEQAIDKLKVGEMSPLVETPFGYFLLKLENKKEPQVHSLDEVKDKIAAKMTKEANKKNWAEQKRKSLEAILASGKSIEPELKNLKIEIKKTGAFSIGQGYIPNVGQVDSMLDGVAELTKEKPISPKLYYHQDAYYFLKLRSVELPKSAEMEKNRETVEKKVATDIQSELMKGWVDELRKKANVQTEVAFGGKGAKDGKEAGMPGENETVEN